MSLFLHGIQAVHEQNLGLPPVDPNFRKATSNMLAAYQVCHQTLSGISEAKRKNMPVVVATHFGEVSSSLEFLTTYHEMNLSKPILFQNSLHNSTLGFISIQLGLQGPAFTISADAEMDSAVMNMAETLTAYGPDILVCYVDIVPEYLKKYYSVAFPQLENNLGWARSFLLSTEEPTQAATKVDLRNFSYQKLLENEI